MGVCYDMISDSTREGYELGKGPWGDIGALRKALGSEYPIGGLVALLVDADFEALHATQVAHDVTAFASAHPDWRETLGAG